MTTIAFVEVRIVRRGMRPHEKRAWAHLVKAIARGVHCPELHAKNRMEAEVMAAQFGLDLARAIEEYNSSRARARRDYERSHRLFSRLSRGQHCRIA